MVAVFTKMLAKQLSHPQGFWGYFVLRKLNRLNANIIQQTIALSDVQESNNVLDIGFGGGLSFEILRQKNINLQLCGLERSDKAINQAKHKFKKDITSKNLTLEYGNVERMPFADGMFDRIISINTVYFWDDLEAAFKEVKRVLKPEGNFILALREVEVLKKFPPTAYGFNFHETGDIISAMEEAGFSTSITKREDDYPFICIKAE